MHYIAMSGLLIFWLAAANSQEMIAKLPISRAQLMHNITVINDNSPSISVNISTLQDKQHSTIPLVSSQRVPQIVTRIFAHKGSFFLGSCCAIYGAVVLYRAWLARMLQRGGSWSSWKSDFSSAALKEIPQETNARELYNAINAHYNACEQPNILIPLMRFVTDIELEMLMCDRYLTLHSWLEKTKLSLLLTTPWLTVNEVQEKKQRLMFLNNLMIGWLTEYRVEK